MSSDWSTNASFPVGSYPDSCCMTVTPGCGENAAPADIYSEVKFSRGYISMGYAGGVILFFFIREKYSIPNISYASERGIQLIVCKPVFIG